MKAYRLLAWQQPPELRDVPVPEPGPGEVLVRVGAAGACHSDLHVMGYAPGARPWTPPFTLGHENAGWVAALGRGVRGLEVGEPVAVQGSWGCGRCPACRASRDNYCQRRAEVGSLGGGLGRDGGMAEHLRVPDARLLVPLGDLDPVRAAPLTDAGLTPYHTIKRSLHRLVPGTTALVIGVGGLGHMALQLLRALSPAAVLAVDVDPDKVALARAVGADEALVSGDGTAAAVGELTRGLGADLVLDFVGREETLALAAACVRAEGEVTVVGAAGGTLPWRFGGLAPGASLTGVLWGSGAELAEVLELARRGVIAPRVETFPLSRVQDAYARLREGTVDGRAVVVPDEDLDRAAGAP